MKLSEKINKAITESRALDDFEALENHSGNLIITATLNVHTIELWRRVTEEIDDYFKIIFRVQENYTEIYLDQAPIDEKLNISISFESNEKYPIFLTIQGWESFLNNSNAMLLAEAVYICGLKKDFHNKSFKVLKWDSSKKVCAIDESISNTENYKSPRSCIRTLSGDFMPPEDPTPFILTSEVGSDKFFDIWLNKSINLLCLSLVNELFLDKNTPTLRVNSNKKSIDIKFIHSKNQNIYFYNKLSEVIKWIYFDCNDTEVRHTLFSDSLATHWSDKDLIDGLSEQIESIFNSAKITYMAYLRSISYETIKNLSDLKKSLNDEIQKLIQQTRDLTNSLWKDVAITIGIIAFRVSGAASETEESYLFGFVYIIISTYILISFWIITRANDKFLNMIEITRTDWKKSIYGYLNEDQFQNLVLKPSDSANEIYQSTKFLVSIIISILSFILLTLAFYEFGYTFSFIAESLYCFIFN